MTFTTFAAALVAALLLPVLILLWATESKATRIKRLKKTHTWRQIAERYGVSQTTVRRWAM